jgi:hypothetical protein
MYAVFFVRVIFFRTVVEQYAPGGSEPIVELMMFYAPDECAQEKGGNGKADYE